MAGKTRAFSDPDQAASYIRRNYRNMSTPERRALATMTNRSHGWPALSQVIDEAKRKARTA